MIIRATVLVALFLAGAGLIARAEKAEAVPVRTPLADLPTSMDGWSGRNDPPMTNEVLNILGVDDYVLRTYWQKQQWLNLYVGYYESQRSGASIHSPMNCMPGAGWTPVQRERQMIDVATAAGPRTIEVNRVLIEKGLERQVVLYWYQSHGRVLASEYSAKAYMVLDAIRENRTDAALVRVIVPLRESTAEAAEAADRVATSFVQGVFPALETHLPS